MKTTAAAALALLALAACGDKASTGPAPAEAATRTAAAARPAAGRNWTQVATVTPGGGVLLGNPNAPVKFLEFASLTCPHCRDFSREADAGLRAYVATGKLSYEFRPFLLNGFDAAISSALRCLPPLAQVRATEQLYATQEVWLERYRKIDAAKGKELQALPKNRVLIALADVGGMDEFFRLRGLTRAKYEACLSNDAGMTQLQAVSAEAVKKYQLEGTPLFVVNDQSRKDLRSWSDVDRELKRLVG